MDNKSMPYTTDDHDYIRLYYGTTPTLEIAQTLGRSYAQIRKQASKLGITKQRGHNIQGGKAQTLGVVEDGTDAMRDRVFEKITARHTWPTIETPVLNEIIGRRRA